MPPPTAILSFPPQTFFAKHLFLTLTALALPGYRGNNILRRGTPPEWNGFCRWLRQLFVWETMVNAMNTGWVDFTCIELSSFCLTSRLAKLWDKRDTASVTAYVHGYLEILSVITRNVSNRRHQLPIWQQRYKKYSIYISSIYKSLWTYWHEFLCIERPIKFTYLFPFQVSGFLTYHCYDSKNCRFALLACETRGLLWAT